MDSNYYKEYFHLERSNWWFTARLEILKSFITKNIYNKKELKILNIGVATGATSVMLEQFGQVKSIEYDESCYEFVKNTLSIDIEQGSILELQFENETFDLVCAFDVIEHVEDHQKAVDEMKRVCKSNGMVFVTVPAFMSLWGQHDVVNHHYRRYKRKELELLFNENGNVVFSSYFNFYTFLPAYLVRKLSNRFPRLLKRDGSGSDHSMFKLGMFNNVLHHIFLSEKHILCNNITFPVGVSAMLMWKKVTQ